MDISTRGAPQTAASVPLRFSGPGAWKGSDLRRSSSWIRRFTTGERDELEALWGRLASQGATEAGATSFQATHGRAFPALSALMRETREILRTGRGFALMRGFPLDRLPAGAPRLVYLALGSWLGGAMPQNRQRELIHDVRDTGADRTDPNVRLSTTNAEQDFHTDAADVIGLLCLKTAKAGGLSRIVSSVSVYNAVADQRPDLVPRLFGNWAFHLKGEHAPGAKPYAEMPIAHIVGGQLSSFYIGWYIRHAPLLPGVRPLTSQELELLSLYEAAANDPELYLDMDFQPGDIQWLKNSTILHKRTEYVDWPESSRKRHLLRLWLAAPDFGDGIEATRHGHAAAAAGAPDHA